MYPWKIKAILEWGKCIGMYAMLSEPSLHRNNQAMIISLFGQVLPNLNTFTVATTKYYASSH